MHYTLSLVYLSCVPFFFAVLRYFGLRKGSPQFPPNIYFTSDPKFAYSYFSTHASLTGNATSQAFLAFFHATGYADTVPVDQAKAMLYYTFAAQGGHKGAQMALAYRYWSGISTLEDCSRAVEWYEAAADTGKYLRCILFASLVDMR